MMFGILALLDTSLLTFTLLQAPGRFSLSHPSPNPTSPGPAFQVLCCSPEQRPARWSPKTSWSWPQASALNRTSGSRPGQSLASCSLSLFMTARKAWSRVLVLKVMTWALYIIQDKLSWKNNVYWYMLSNVEIFIQKIASTTTFGLCLGTLKLRFSLQLQTHLALSQGQI